MSAAIIVSAARTPLGKFQGELTTLAATELGAIALRAALDRADFPAEALDEVIVGNVLTGGLGQAPARQAALLAGVPPSVGAFLVNKVCGSGLKAVMLADQAIRAGDARAVLAGGMESMTNAPYLLPRARAGYRLGHGELLDSLISDGLWDPWGDYPMGCTGELVARTYGIDRAAQDRYAAESYRRALAAQQACAFRDEIVPVTIVGRRGGETVVDRDENVRETSMEDLARLRPAFEDGGTVTAGNASSLADGAAAVLVLAEEEAARRGLAPLGRILATATHSGEPEWLMMAPVHAIRRVAERGGVELEAIDLFEINEPFAVATVAIIGELGLDAERVNAHGGAVALGHPIGATGARLLVTLLHALQRRQGRLGVAALCLGGGEAVAMLIERPG